MSFLPDKESSLPQKDHFAENFAWRDLFSQDLAAWNTWLGKPYQPLSLLGSKNEKLSEQLGLNYDPLGVFTLVEEDGKKTLRITGQVSGGLITKEEFDDYHFSVKYRWGEKIWPNTLGQDRKDSGILIHCFGPPGGVYRYWMKSVEYQIRDTHAGDLWVLDTLADAPVERRKSEKGTFFYHYHIDSPLRMITECAMSQVKPKTSNTWNQADIYTKGNSAVYLINGRVSMVLTNIRKLHEDGGAPLHKGLIQLQSAGAEIFFQEAQIRPLKKFPTKFQELIDQITTETTASH